MSVCNLLNPRSGIWLVKLEATPGTFEAMDLDDQLPVMVGSSIATSVQHGEVRLDQAAGGEHPAPVITAKPTAQLQVPIYGKGVVASNIVLPKWLSVLLATVGDIDTTTNTDRAVWTPGLQRGAECTFSLSQLFGQQDGDDWRQQRMAGCTVGSVQFGLSPGGVLVATINVLGRMLDPVDEELDPTGATNDGLLTDFIVPNALESKIGTVDTYQSSFDLTVDYGATHIDADSDEFGVLAALGSDLTINGTINPIVRDAATVNWLQEQLEPIRYDAGAYDPVALSTSAVKPQGRAANTGYGVAFNVPAIQYTGDIDRSGQGVIRFPASWKAVRSSNDPSVPLMSLTLR